MTFDKTNSKHLGRANSTVIYDNFTLMAWTLQTQLMRQNQKACWSGLPIYASLLCISEDRSNISLTELNKPTDYTLKQNKYQKIESIY